MTLQHACPCLEANRQTGNQLKVAQWDLQVDTVESGDVNIGPDFKVANYED